MKILVLSVSFWEFYNHFLAVRIKFYLIVIWWGGAYRSIWITATEWNLLEVTVVIRDAHRCLILLLHLPSLLLKELTYDVLVDGRHVLRLLLRCGCHNGWHRLCLSAIVEPILWDEWWLEAFAELGELGAQAQEKLELNGFFNRWHESKLLQVHL